MLVAALPGRRGLLCFLRIDEEYDCIHHHVVSSFLVVLRVVYQNRRGNGVEKIQIPY